MKDSITTILFEFIKKYDYVTYDAIVDKADEIGCKIETATRKLRGLCTKKNGHIPLVETITKGKVIIGYRYIGPRERIIQETKPVENNQPRLFEVPIKKLSPYDI